MKHRDNYTFLTQAPIHKVIPTMAAPTIISMLVTSMYNIADTFFVGQIDTQSTAAVGIVFAVMAIIQAVGFLFGQGAGVTIAQELGARDVAAARKMAATSFVYAVVAGVLITVAGLVFLRPISLALGSTPTILPYTERYMRIILLGAPFITASMTLNNQMRFQGNASMAMIGIVSGAVLNVVLDPILILGFNMGVAGAAIATVSGQAFSFLLLMYMSRKGENIRINLRNFAPTRKIIIDIMRGGTPSLTRQALGSLATICLNVVASKYGDAAIAGMSIVTRITFFVYSVIIGIGQGYQPLCGFCYGAALYGRVREGFWFCVKIGTAFLVVCAVLGFYYASMIVGIFRDDPDVIAIGTAAFRWQLVSYPLGAFMMMGNMLMQTIGKALKANIAAGSRRGLFFIPFIFILPRFFGLTGVEMCQAVSDVCAFALTVPLVYSELKKMKTD